MPFVSLIEKILNQQRLISDEGVGNNTRGLVCSPFFSHLIALAFAGFDLPCWSLFWMVFRPALRESAGLLPLGFFSITMKRMLLLLGFTVVAQAAPPRDALPWDAPQWPQNYRLHLEGSTKVSWGEAFSLPLNAKDVHDIAIEHPAKGVPLLRQWTNGKLVRGPEKAPWLRDAGGEFPDAGLDLGADFTAMVHFRTSGDGTLFAKCAPKDKWSPDAKALFVRKGQLVYDIGWWGEMGGGKVDDGKPHTVVLSVNKGHAQLWLDGKRIAEKKEFTRPDGATHVWKVGRATEDFGGAFEQGSIASLKVWKRAMATEEVSLFFHNKAQGANTPDFTYLPRMQAKPSIEGGSGWVQALERSDHADIVRGWNAKSLKEGAEIYQAMCIVCHGDKEKQGSLPTALRFAEGVFKNGADPYSMHHTLTHGYNQMTAMPQYTTAQKYAVIHYIRETYLRNDNPAQYTPLTDDYLTSLPKAMASAEAEKADRSLPPYKLMELGPFLQWTYQIEPGNIAQKGIAIRLDDGPGGVTKGRAWMIYDHDTMRVAAATTGDFVDWRGIAFDGSHGTHTSLIGEKHFINPEGPGWTVDDFEDKRVPAKDGKKYGPHPGMQYKEIFFHGNQCLIYQEIYGAQILESPSWIDNGDKPVFVRTIHGMSPWQVLKLRVAPDSLHVVMKGDASLEKNDGFWVATLHSDAKTRFFISRADPESLEALATSVNTPIDLWALTKGGPAQWPATVTTTSIAGKEDATFVTDEFPLPVNNPYQSWMRPGGFDFTPDGKAAIVAMWNGDVWRVDGIKEKAPATLTWRRIASGLFQPLGVKFRGNDLFVTCRDQIAKLVDLNGDGEIDQIVCFNNDAQVTEHFHEFAMGLQTDKEGNFYYAKSARHALDSVVPQHGTLLKVSADGTTTTIVANGFRAANGVCLNEDGSFFVTDQEGHWTPKNRINRVKPGGFYGNIYSYGAPADKSDSAMQPPMVWMTNAMDRSPAELLWVPKNAWGNLGGSLLNLSYGTGRAFIVPHEEVKGQWQGAVCELPMPAFATGIMRGRFADDGALYTCGMFAWAGNAQSPGGFHRIRRGNGSAPVPLSIHAAKGAMTLTFSEPIPTADATMKIWQLQRTANYGSKHIDEKSLTIQESTLSDDKRTLTLLIPDLVPTQCYELKIGTILLHGTIHQLHDR
jgi:cytochrome c5